ncbi:hypothetical protein [Aliarcobacter butzleri]|uniref:hypothetical protein n=1 Tax=Aliarcobacter butzleri TaxID=28197 RepID=UPI002B24F05B|nr:hypothetical protein [Aliarcobacter butzleri]
MSNPKEVKLELNNHEEYKRILLQNLSKGVYSTIEQKTAAKIIECLETNIRVLQNKNSNKEHIDGIVSGSILLYILIKRSGLLK